MRAKTMLSEDVRQNWRDTLDYVYAGGDVVIQRYSKPLAVLISYQDYVAITEELEDLRAGRRADEILARAEGDADAFVPWEDIRAEMLGEGSEKAEE